MWTKEALADLVQTRLSDRRLIVVANREPYSHHFVGGQIECIHPVSGMVSALDPLLRSCGGVWVAHASGTADRKTADARGRISVPPDDPAYTLRRVWLSRPQEDGYYNGLSNQGIWPMCHMAFVRPVYEPQHWEAYRQVNTIFAQAVLEEANGDPAFVFVQDYHLALLPRMLKERNPNLIIAHFWHIPWPTPMALQTFPWKEKLLEGLLGNDLMGFHLRSHCQHFLDSVDRTLEAKIDSEGSAVTRGGHSTLVRPFPIGIDFDEQETIADSPDVERAMDRWRDRLGLGTEYIGLGIDRIDYTKGIPERFRALDRFFEVYPQYRERLIFVQIGVPSRVHVPQYKELDDELDHLVEDINWRWSTDSWRPIIYLKKQYDSVDMAALHRLADFCVVSSLDDGMNLVAKEFVASRADENGVLILSRFAGASRELTNALLVNPHAVDELAGLIRQAIEMPDDERRRRMHKMRSAVAENNVYRWAGKLLSALLKFDIPDNYGRDADYAAVGRDAAEGRP